MQRSATPRYIEHLRRLQKLGWLRSLGSESLLVSALICVVSSSLAGQRLNCSNLICPTSVAMPREVFLAPAYLPENL